MKGVYDRIADLRQRLVEKLDTLQIDRKRVFWWVCVYEYFEGGWKRIANQKGFFTLLPLTRKKFAGFREK